MLSGTSASTAASASPEADTDPGPHRVPNRTAAIAPHHTNGTA